MPPRVGAQRHCPDLGLLSRHVELSALFHGKLWAYLVLSPQGVKNFEDWHGSAPILLTHKVTLYLAPPSGICQMDKRLLNLSSHSVLLSLSTTELRLVWPQEVLGQVIRAPMEVLL